MTEESLTDLPDKGFESGTVAAMRFLAADPTGAAMAAAVLITERLDLTNDSARGFVMAVGLYTIGHGKAREGSL